VIEFSSEMGAEELRARVDHARAQGADVRLEPPPPPQAMAAPPRSLEYVRLDLVTPAVRNPKGHDAPSIARSIEHHGLGELPLRDERTGRLVAGHGRLEQLLAMYAQGDSPPDGVMVDPSDGMWRMPVVAGWSSRSDADAEAYLIGSNQITAAGGWDTSGLAEILADLKEVDLAGLTGFDDEAITAILEDEARRSAVPVEPEPPAEFPAYGEDIETQHRCPACGYEWSGSTRPGAPDGPE
jgi:hypothetical protein